MTTKRSIDYDSVLRYVLLHTIKTVYGWELASLTGTVASLYTKQK